MKAYCSNANKRYLCKKSVIHCLCFFMVFQITAEQLYVLEGHAAIVTFVCFSFDGKYLASTSYDKSAIVWNLEGEMIVINFETKCDVEFPFLIGDGKCSDWMSGAMTGECGWDGNDCL